MAESTGINILVAATAVGIAVWAQLIESAPERIERREGRYWRVVTGSLYLSSLVILASLLVAVGITSIKLGGVAAALYFVLFALLLASIPTVFVITNTMMEPFLEMNYIRETIVPLAVIITILLGSYIAAAFGVTLF